MEVDIKPKTVSPQEKMRRIVENNKRANDLIDCLQGKFKWSSVCGFCKGYPEQQPLDECPGCNGIPF
jgi:hypothetical protein